MGPTSAAECNAVFALVKSGPVTWCYSSAVNAEPGSFQFQTSATNYDYNAAAIHWLRLRGLTRIALITPTDATGQTYDRAIDAILALPENKGMMLVDHEHFNPGDVSVDAQISRIRASTAQVVLVGTAGTPAGIVFHGITDVGLEPAGRHRERQRLGSLHEAVRVDSSRRSCTSNRPTAWRRRRSPTGPRRRPSTRTRRR